MIIIHEVIKIKSSYVQISKVERERAENFTEKRNLERRIFHGKRKIEQRTFERREYCSFCENDFASTLDLKRHMKKKQCYGLYNIVRKAFGKSLIRKKHIKSTFDIPKFEREQGDNRMKKYGDVGRIISKFSASKIENEDIEIVFEGKKENMKEDKKTNKKIF